MITICSSPIITALRLYFHPIIAVSVDKWNVGRAVKCLFSHAVHPPFFQCHDSDTSAFFLLLQSVWFVSYFSYSFSPLFLFVMRSKSDLMPQPPAKSPHPPQAASRHQGSISILSFCLQDFSIIIFYWNTLFKHVWNIMPYFSFCICP